MEDYYDDMSAGCLGKIQQIAVPTLTLHACDDVIMTPRGIPLEAAQTNENLIFLMTATGGKHPLFLMYHMYASYHIYTYVCICASG